MLWRDVYTALLNKKSQADCLSIAIACCDKAIGYSLNPHIAETLDTIKLNQNKKIISDKISMVAVIRVGAKDLPEKESAHIVLHAAEAAIANTYQSAAGHTARCLEALSRINGVESEEICFRFGVL